jgi:predicted outer membrane repeat protein
MSKLFRNHLAVIRVGASTFLLTVMLLANSQRVQAGGVVGNGTPGSCTEAALTSALVGGGTVTFNCGAAPKVITTSVAQSISADTVIDGGNKITLDGGGTAAFYQVFSDRQLVLRNLTLTRGGFTGMHALENFGTLVMERVVFQNTATTDSALRNLGTLEVTNSQFRGLQDTDGGKGSAIYSDGGTVSIANSSFTNNGLLTNLHVGGAIVVDNGYLTVTNSIFSGNQAWDGGAVYVDTTGNAFFERVTFSGNRAGYGAAIEGRGIRVIVHDSTLVANVATIGDGGAIWMLGGDLDVVASQFHRNEATTTGGAVSCYSSNVSIISSSLISNTAGTNGGAIYSTCGLNLTNNTISQNRATAGGGIYQAGSGFASAGYQTIANNSATAFGGGIYNDDAGGATLSVEKSILVNNNVGNCDGVITSGGYNLTQGTICGGLTLGTDRQNQSLPLGPARNNGGLTLTRLPLAGNAAINFIPSGLCGFSEDQRGTVRPSGSGCDAGAVEVISAFLPFVDK